MTIPDPTRKSDLTAAVERDVRRHRQREVGSRSFWRSLGLLGMVGWPIALMTVGGAALGRWLDDRFGTGVACTLLLLLLGAAAGSWVAWRSVRS